MRDWFIMTSATIQEAPKQSSWTKEALSEDLAGFGIFNDLEKLSKKLPKL